MILTKYQGGDTAAKGTYWDLRNGTRVDLDEAGVLPGGPKLYYRKMSPVVMLIVAPFAGLLYVIALPFVAIGTVLAVTARKASAAVLDFLGFLVAFTWQPARAYLLGKKKKQKEDAGQQAKEENKEPS